MKTAEHALVNGTMSPSIRLELRKKQRRLLLLTINEAYAIFKERYPNIRIGISKFAEMRPKECTLISDKKGAHATCICIYHQNVKLIFNALKAKNFFDADILTAWEPFLH